MDRIAQLPERKLEVVNLTWNEFGRQSLVLGKGRVSLTKETEGISPGDWKTNSQGCCCLEARERGS